MQDLKTFWGESHHNTYQSPSMPVAFGDVLVEAAKHLDFYAAAYYTSEAPAFEAAGHVFESDSEWRLVLEQWKSPERIAREYAEVEHATAARNSPGSFVTFPGYEWQGNGTSGDHNVFSLAEGLPVFRVETIDELYEKLRGRDAVAIPHHTAYRPGMRGRGWSVFDEDLSPFAEIYSLHGSSETDEERLTLRHNRHMGPAMGAGTYQAALEAGLHLGAVCSTDGWRAEAARYGQGIMAVLADELTRKSLWSAFKARRVYGSTGDRILLGFTVDGASVGSIIASSGPRKVEVSVSGSDAIDRIEILKGSRVVATYCHQGQWSPPRPGRKCRWKLRIEAGWGPHPREIETGDHRWKGRIEVSGGRMISWEPCWISTGQEPPALSGGQAAFEFLSRGEDVTSRWQNADVFEFEAAPESNVAISLNGLSESAPLGELASSSRIMWFRDECVDLLARNAGIAPDSPEREDVYYHAAWKAKIHRAIPEAAYTARFEYIDEEPLSGETHYRVRVEERNGQRAWSSPIWVRPA